MFLNEKEIENSANQYELVGTVSEYNLTLKQNKQKVKVDGEENEINSSILYGTIVTDVNGVAIKNNVLVSKFTKGGDEKKSFKGLCTIAGIEYDKDTYSFGERPLKPTIDGVTTIIPRDAKTKEEHKVQNHKGCGKEADRVRIVGQTDREEYLNKDASDLVVGKKLSVGNVSTQNIPSEDKATFDIGGCVYAINDEYDNQGATTGRKLVDLVNIGFFGGNVFTLIVPNEWEVGEGEDKQTLKVQDFLDTGHKVKITVFYRGRELAHKELGFKLAERVIAGFGDAIAVDQPPQLAGKQLNFVIRSNTNAKAKNV